MISVVIPVFNEKESVALLHAELVAALGKLGQPFELLYVDDGSTDGTRAELASLSPARVIAFTRNFGKSQALMAGFAAAKGEYIFTIDGDLQDDPLEMHRFLEAMGEGSADIVCGWKQKRRDSAAKRLVSKVANGLTRVMTGVMVHDMNCGFKLFRAEAARALDLYGDMHRYIPALAAARGFRVAEVPVNHRQRRFGYSKYGNFRRFFKSFFDFVTLLLMRRFIDRPMHFFGTMGFLSALAGALVLAYLAYIKIMEGAAIGNRPLLLLGILLIVIGMQLFSSGFLGELIIRQKPTKGVYTVRDSTES